MTPAKPQPKARRKPVRKPFECWAVLWFEDATNGWHVDTIWDNKSDAKDSCGIGSRVVKLREVKR